MTLELGKLNAESLGQEFVSVEAQETAEEIAAREAAEKAAGDTGAGGDGSGDSKGGGTGSDNDDDQSGSNQLSQEEIEALRAKPESDLTDEEKATLAELDNQGLDTIDYVRQQFGIETVFENTAEGFTGLAQSIKAAGKQEGVAEFLESAPIVKEFIEHLQAGKSIDTFKTIKTPTSYEAVEVSDENAEALVRANLAAKGFKDKQIDTYISAVKDENRLVEEGNDAKEELVTRETAQKTAIINAENEALRLQAEADAKTVADINTLLTTGNLNGIQIPKEDLGILKDFIFKPTNERNETARDIKYNSLTLEQRLLLDYIVAKDFKVTGLQKQTAKSATGGLGKVGDKNALRGAGSSSSNNKEGNLNDLPVIRFGGQ